MNSSVFSNYIEVATLTLFSDGDPYSMHFSICSEHGVPVWSDCLRSDEFNGYQPGADMAAAMKAVWLASKVRDAVEANEVRLTLKVDAEWLKYANEVFNGGGRGKKARDLGYYAQRLRVNLTVSHTKSADNAAHQHNIRREFKQWEDNEWANLVIKRKEDREDVQMYYNVEDFFE